MPVLQLLGTLKSPPLGLIQRTASSSVRSSRSSSRRRRAGRNWRVRDGCCENSRLEKGMVQTPLLAWGPRRPGWVEVGNHQSRPIFHRWSLGERIPGQGLLVSVEQQTQENRTGIQARGNYLTDGYANTNRGRR